MTGPLDRDQAFAQLVTETMREQAEQGWRIFTTDLLTDRVLCYQLPAAVARFSYGKINTFGEAELLVSLDAATDPVLLTEPRRTCVWIMYRGEILSGGILWEREPDLASRTLRLKASTWSSYYWRRLIRDTVANVNTDQLDIFRGLIDYAHAKPSGNIGVTVNALTSGVRRTRYYGPGAGDDASPDKKIGEALVQLAELENGFEFTDTWTMSAAGVPAKLIQVGYPLLGLEFAPGQMYEYPGKIVTYTWPTFGDSPNSYVAVGAGDGAFMLTATAANAAELTVGYPLLEESSGGEYKDVITRATLQEHANEDLAAFTGGRLAPTFTIALPGDTVADLPQAGDLIRVRLTSAIHRPTASGAPGIDRRLRVTGVEVTPSRADQDGRAVLSTVAG